MNAITDDLHGSRAQTQFFIGRTDEKNRTFSTPTRTAESDENAIRARGASSYLAVVAVTARGPHTNNHVSTAVQTDSTFTDVTTRIFSGF